MGLKRTSTSTSLSSSFPVLGRHLEGRTLVSGQAGCLQVRAQLPLATLGRRKSPMQRNTLPHCQTGEPKGFMAGYQSRGVPIPPHIT